MALSVLPQSLARGWWGGVAGSHVWNEVFVCACRPDSICIIDSECLLIFFSVPDPIF